MINDDCAEFQAEWNAHPISGAANDQSPNDMFLLGQLENGVHLDDCDGVHPDVIEELYGVHGAVVQRMPGQSGAGQLNDEDIPLLDDSLDVDVEDWEDMIEKEGIKSSTRRITSKDKEPASVGTFWVNAIIILGEGIVQHRDKMLLENNQIPSKAVIQMFVNQGLAVRKDNGIEISMSATHDEIIDLLSSLLPRPMVYFNHIGLTVFTEPSSGLEIWKAPPWVHLSRVRQHLEIVQVVNPTGRDFYTHRGSKTATEDRYIFLSSRMLIPKEEKISWYTPQSLAFTMPSRSDSDEETGDTGKRKGKKHISSIAFGDSDSAVSQSEAELLSKKQVAPKKRTKRATRTAAGARWEDNLYSTSHWEDDFASIFNDDVAQDIESTDTTTTDPSCFLTGPFRNIPTYLPTTVVPFQASGRSDAVAGSSGTSRHGNAVAGPSQVSGHTNAVAGSLATSSTDTIDLTGGTPRSPSLELPFFMRNKTPERTQLPINPSFSDPIDFTYGSSPKAPRRFF
ncbi:hypothetical protein B0H17DRAFT_1193343 [Mycena rosella]|uniref:Uncharacterized protein n=1 Tax=Mycena rosella TaxID=1033263 RepID=A0AAD7GT74_MYCRO|nr:hypothetical protein B0H17DRAFT_1193343 [Mycena rosella]